MDALEPPFRISLNFSRSSQNVRVPGLNEQASLSSIPCYHATDMSVVVGQLLAGKYRVESVLGQGGMGVVVAARHIALDEMVAIKFLLPEVLRSAEAVARFDREARAAVRIRSEHVARVMDVGLLETGAPYMVMELLRGRDLGQELERRGPLPLEDVADYMLQAGEAIAEAHSLGIVHRDLKPPNLFLSERADGSSCVKVLDFGISKVTSSSSTGSQGMTSTSAVMGSPLYMSPEQLMSARAVDMRTDIWALGVICYELLSGTLPFLADSLPQLCMSISLAPPTPLSKYRPDLPAAVEQLLFRCLEKDPSKRVATVAELAAELVKFAPRHAWVSAERIERLARTSGFATNSLRPPLPSGEQSVASPNVKAQTLGEFGRTKAPASSSNLRVGLIAAAVLVLVSAAGGVLLFSRRLSVARGPVPASAARDPAAPQVVLSTAAETRTLPTVEPSATVSAAAPSAPASTPSTNVLPRPVRSPKPIASDRVARTPSPLAKPVAPASGSAQGALGGRL